MFFVDGHFLVAVARDNDEEAYVSSLIKCYQVLVKKTHDRLHITSQPLPSFFFNEGSLKDVPHLNLTHLKWICNEDADSLIVGSSCKTGCILESWTLVEKSTQIHKIFQTSKNDYFKTAVS